MSQPYFVYEDRTPFLICIDLHPRASQLVDLIKEGGGIPSDISIANFYVGDDPQNLTTRDVPVVRDAWIEECIRLKKLVPVYTYLVERRPNRLSLLSLNARNIAEALKMLLEETSMDDRIRRLHRKFPHNSTADWQSIYSKLMQWEMGEWVQGVKDRRQDITDTAILSIIPTVQSFPPTPEDQFTNAPVTPPDLTQYIPPDQSDISMEDIEDMKQFISLYLYGEGMTPSEHTALSTRVAGIMSRIGAN